MWPPHYCRPLAHRAPAPAPRPGLEENPRASSLHRRRLRLLEHVVVERSLEDRWIDQADDVLAGAQAGSRALSPCRCPHTGTPAHRAGRRGRAGFPQVHVPRHHLVTERSASPHPDSNPPAACMNGHAPARELPRPRRAEVHRRPDQRTRRHLTPPSRLPEIASRPLLSLARLANAPTRQPENVSPHQFRD